MNIRIQTKADKSELLEGRSWHWRKYGLLQYCWYVAGAIFSLVGFAAFGSDDHLVGAMLIFFGFYCVLRKKILEIQFCRRIKAIPGFGTVTDWEFTEDGISQASELGRVDLSWDAIFETITTPSGILLYQQKHLYYWLPLSGFEEQSQFDTLKSVLEERTKNKTIA